MLVFLGCKLNCKNYLMNFDQDFIDPKVVEGFGREKSPVTRKVTYGNFLFSPSCIVYPPSSFPYRMVTSRPKKQPFLLPFCY